VTVQGSIADVVLPHLLAGATHVIVAMPGQPGEVRERVITLARQTGLPVLSVPPRSELQGEPDALATRIAAPSRRELPVSPENP